MSQSSVPGSQEHLKKTAAKVGTQKQETFSADY